MKFFKKTKLIATLSAVALLGGVTYAVTGCGEPTEEPKQNSDVMQALVARITAIEEKLSDFEASLADKVSKDHNQDFGSNPSMPKGKEEGKRIADIMYSYAGDNARKYY